MTVRTAADKHLKATEAYLFSQFICLVILLIKLFKKAVTFEIR